MYKIIGIGIALCTTGCSAIQTEIQVSYQSGGTSVTTTIRR
jgi:hypothetical protein